MDHNMNILDRFYVIFLCLTREDGTGDRHKRAAALLEMVSTFFLSSITMVVLGLVNLRMTNFMLYVAINAAHGGISYLFFNRYFIKSMKYKEMIEYANQYSKGKKVAFAFLAAFVVLFSFGLLIGGGVLMSYLYSQHV